MIHRTDSIEDLQEIINTIIDHLPLGVFVKDVKDNLNYLYWNKFMEDVTGIDTINIEGKNDSTVSYDALISAEKNMELEKRITYTGETVEFHGVIKTPSGESKDIEMTKYPLSLKNGKQLLLVLWRDVTAKKTIKNELKRTQTLTEMALKSINVQTSSITVNPDSLNNYNDSIVELFYTKDKSSERKCIPWPIMLKRIHPDYQQIYEEQFALLFKGAINESKIEIIGRMFDSEEYRWRETSAYVYERDEKGRPTVLLCCSIDIQDRKKQEQNLSDAKDKAENADLLKSKYLANMNHEIRTPLNAITGFSELMAYADSDEERKEYYEIIKANNILLMQLVNDILDLSKIEANVTNISYAPIDLNELMLNIHLSAKLRIQKEDVKLFVEKGEKNCTFIADSNRLMQLINNLINNAIKNTSKGNITFGYTREGEMMKFFVRDTGIGIAKDKLSSIFNRYVKINDYVEGIGLGLAICHGLVTRMNGNITVESELGKGSEFIFTLPIINDLSYLEFENESN